MTVKIYFGHKTLFLTDNLDAHLTALSRQTSTILTSDFKADSVRSMISEMESGGSEAGIFIHSDVHELLNAFRQNLVVMDAAGGLVYDLPTRFLMIFRRGKWDLPKGKVDPGEDLPACALREVREETGLHRLQLEKKLGTTYHTYTLDGQLVLKESHWFLMRGSIQDKLVPQLDEDIEQCQWVSTGDLKAHLDNAHYSVRDVMEEGRALFK